MIALTPKQHEFLETIRLMEKERPGVDLIGEQLTNGPVGRVMRERKQMSEPRDIFKVMDEMLAVEPAAQGVLFGAKESA